MSTEHLERIEGELAALREESRFDRIAIARLTRTIESLQRTLESDTLPPKDAADYLGISEHTLARWRSDGRHNAPPFERRGSRIFYRRSDLERWTREHRENEPDPVLVKG